MSIFLTRQRYQYACVFVDNHSDFTYVHLINTQTGDEAVEAKETFKTYVEYHGVDINHHNSDKWNFQKCTMDEPLQVHATRPHFLWI